MLEPIQSAPGNRFSGPDGKDYDIIARVSTDAGPFVVIIPVDALVPGLPVGFLVSEGDLRDSEDVAFVSTTAAAKEEAAQEIAKAEAAQIAADRQARIDAANQATGTTGTTDGVSESGTTAPPTPTP